MGPINPSSREEFFMRGVRNALQGNDTGVNIEPSSRMEYFLNEIIEAVTGGDSGDIPPSAREEMFLDGIADVVRGDSDTYLSPSSRVEKFMKGIANVLQGEDSGVDIEPSSRREYFLWEILEAAANSGAQQTVTGNFPLTFAGALAGRIKSLIQYGLCTQDGTPTPAASVPIMCNNGAVQMVDDELPTGYKRLVGIRFDGDTYYETDEAMSGDDDVTMTLDNTSTQGQNVFGSYNGTAAGAVNFSLFIYGGGSTSNSYFRYGDQLLRPRYGTGERTITFGKSGTDGFLTDVSATPDTFETPANAYIGMLPNSTSPPYTGDIIGDILVGTRLKWIPCERESDNAIGYYEAVKGNFIAPSGTGTPTSLGYDGSHYHLAVVGTDEVLSVTASGAATQTASVPDLFAVGEDADTHELIGGTVTHKVGIKVFDGTETFSTSTAYGKAFLFNAASSSWGADRTGSVLCTHFLGLPQVTSTQADNTCFFNQTGHFYFRVTDNSDKDAFKAWLAAQYAAGTPVIVLYPLAEETTESVTAQPLTTAAGTNTISATAEVSPLSGAATYTMSKDSLVGTAKVGTAKTA